MLLSRSLLVVAVLAGGLACSGPSVQYDYDAKVNFAGYRTWDWQPAGKARPGAFDNAIMVNRVKNAVAAQFEAKGFRLEPAGAPDFLVAVHLPARASRSRQAHLGLGMGLGPLGVGVAAPVGERHVETTGSIALEVEDYKTGTVVWKATAEGVLDSEDSPEEADAAVAKAAQSLLRRFPPPGR